jgi:hypothetical protein
MRGMSIELPWVMSQKWLNVLFMSYPLPPDQIAHLIPEDMDLDTYEGNAYVSVLPLYMDDIHVRDLPPIPGMRQFPEINLRTYVTHKGTKGVLFISIDADNLIADFFAEHVFEMPYHQSEMTFQKQGDGYNMTSHRPAGGGTSVDFDATYEPYGTPQPTKEGSLEHFLVERYWLFVNDKNGVLHRGKIKHDPWMLQPVHALVTANGIPEAAGIDVSGVDPIMMYSPGTESHMWLLEEVPVGVQSGSIFPWVMEQNENNALFLHWPVDESALRSLVPDKLEIDTFDGQAYVGMIPFQMNEVHIRWLPQIPGTANFPELDFFTLVKYGDRSGLFFLSIDSPSWLVRLVARDVFHVPYQTSKMSYTERNGEFHFQSQRKDAAFDASFEPKGPVFYARDGSLDYFLMERYSLFNTGFFGQVRRGDVEHWRWPLQQVEVEIATNTIAQAVGIDLPDTPPITHFSTGIHERVWPVTGTWAYPGAT